MLYRVLDRAGRFVANINAPHGNNAAVVKALANMFGEPIAGCIRRAYVQPILPKKLVITPMRKDGGPVVRKGRAVIFTALFIHDGKDIG